MPGSSHVIDRVSEGFDDSNSVADAGLLLTGHWRGGSGLSRWATSCARWATGLAESFRRWRRRWSRARPASMTGTRCGLARPHGSWVMKGLRGLRSTVGHWLLGIAFGHVRQLDDVSGVMLARAWAAGARPGAGSLVVDVDPTIVEVHGEKKQGATYGYIRSCRCTRWSR